VMYTMICAGIQGMAAFRERQRSRIIVRSGTDMGKRGSIAVIFAVLSALLGFAYALFRRERQLLFGDLHRRRRLCLTEHGVVEYAISGQGPPVLIIHGTLGGYDQGLAIARLFDQRRFSFIAVSRAGYLGSGIPTGLTVSQQADSYAALLDKLGLEKAAIIGVSGGSPSALAFAHRHPDRCAALVLVSSITRKAPPLPPIFRAVPTMQEVLLRFDFIWWPLYRFGLRPMLLSSGVSAAEIGVAVADSSKREILSAIYRPIMTSSQRRPGVLIDNMQMEGLATGETPQVSIPVFVTHSKNDPLAPFADAEWLVQAIPQAKFLPVDDGGHVFFVVHSERVVPEITAFLESHTP
jgi:2-hydroxy-6-oxonona-2,4-dienedioate hydrolase